MEHLNGNGSSHPLIQFEVSSAEEQGAVNTLVPGSIPGLRASLGWYFKHREISGKIHDYLENKNDFIRTLRRIQRQEKIDEQSSS